MLERILPSKVDRESPGHRLALGLLALIGLAKLLMGARSVVDARGVATQADGIPLDRFAPEAAQTVVALFAAWGLGQVVLALLCAVALFRYRRLAPLVFALLLFENVGRKLIFARFPYASTGTTANLVVNSTFIALMLVGLVLSLRAAPRSSA